VLTLLESEGVNGGMIEDVLCQKFLQGKEYIDDQVSRNGDHKTTMVWVYEKKQVSGADFVYFSDTRNPPYARAVLDAIGFKNGVSHGEIIMTEDGPCLVEMNCRVQGGNGIWRPLCKALTGGYDQVDAAADACVDTGAFGSLQTNPRVRCDRLDVLSNLCRSMKGW